MDPAVTFKNETLESWSWNYVKEQIQPKSKDVISFKFKIEAREELTSSHSCVKSSLDPLNSNKSL